ncbi:MocR-like pyridoxine biosynthesis transcription factor PdxR [Dermatobacter hominis]|uniref:MocR-like pyridoxine biosynthesis transcription factor PdxR n=1 Tax=Dermatobacter hominis TaxID=2884263 RepID=UPI001D1251EC|nr:PLP-dependent aminotransferase family protein [Dermatobacter hominis]UDY35097.1 PLP-dependent aminotransferase family protein [Dermatobacter hominis]
MPRSTQAMIDGTTPNGTLLALDLRAIGRGRRSAVLTEHLRDAIRSRTLAAGTSLPASRALAADLGVSRGVVVRAYEQLAAEGFLEARHGSGTTVAEVPAPDGRGSVAIEHRPSNPGLPSGADFPRAAWSRAAHRGLARLTDAELGYGDPAGLARLREELAAHLGRVRAVLAPPQQVVVTNGFAQASRLVADVLLARGIGRVGVEDPGSPGLREQLASTGLECVPIPVDAEGIDSAALAASRVRAVFVTPAHQFPTGIVMSARRRHALLDWARGVGGLLVEDDYDAELRYDRAPVGALQGLGPDVVLHGGSVSKTLAPGIRLGWLVVPDHMVREVTDAKYAADLCRGVIDQATVAELLASGELDRHRRRSAAEHRRRRDRLVAALGRSFPDWTVSGAAAGLHLVVQLAGEEDEEAVAAAAQSIGIDARPLRGYAVHAPTPRALVVGYGHQRADQLERAVAGLARSLGRVSPE